MMRNRIVSMLVAVLALLLLQEKADADGSDPLSQLHGVSESVSLCGMADEACYEPAGNASSVWQSLALTAIHPCGGLRLLHQRRVWPYSPGVRDLTGKQTCVHPLLRLTACRPLFFVGVQRAVRCYIILRNLRI